MQIKVTLENSPDCELDHKVIRVKNDADAISEAVKGALDTWTLSPGDTIKVIELG